MSHHATIPNIHFTVQSGTFAAREASERLMTGLAPLKLAMEAAGNVELILAEALNNIVEHGYPDPQNGGPISVFCEHKDDCLQIKLIDKGIPMPNGQTPIGLAVDTNVDFMDLPEGGFGWFIIKDLAKEVMYRRVDDTNLLDLQIAIAEGAAN